MEFVYLPFPSVSVLPLVFSLVISLCEARNKTTSPFSFLIGTISSRHQNGIPGEQQKIPPSVTYRYCIIADENIGQRSSHDDVMRWDHFLQYWPFVRGIHQSLVDSPHKEPPTQGFDVSFDVSPKKNCCTNSQIAIDLRFHDTHVIAQ